MIESYTNTSLAAFRRCPREFYLRYMCQFERDDEDREALAVGSAMHKAFDAAANDQDPYAAIMRHAPSALWVEKLRRLYAAHEWYWSDQKLAVVEAEQTFEFEYAGRKYRGQRDAKVQAKDGRIGVLERKTTGFDISSGAMYWDRLRLDVQVGLYALSMPERPSFILYDVIRKPTINPKNISKKDLERMSKELAAGGFVHYYEQFPAEVAAPAIDAGRETPELYGARLSADIGDRPEYYFARREVVRGARDYESLLDDLLMQTDAIEEGRFHRNPDSCATFGLCDFFSLCSMNKCPRRDEAAPEGFRRREHLHPELVDSSNNHKE